jgi:alpha-glucosidase (family GH31 glycosyl hydrolase)
MLQYNQFGIPMCGSDICGFNDNTTPEMCQRWQQLGSFYPFSRNHNAIFNTEQDPGFFGAAVANSTRTALRIRYTLLPYLYTLFYNHNIRGDTVARALWHEFPMDNSTHGIDRQFLWGSGLLVSPVLDEGATSVSAYFPNSPFYDYYTGAEVSTKGASVTLPAPLDFIPVHVHGGNILPTQEPARNTELSRNNPFGLIVALSGGSATGQLYFDDGDTIGNI